MKILVVESDPYARRMFQLILSQAGHTSLFSPTGESGFLAAKESLPDLILLDITFPDPDGVQFLQELRAAPETEAISVIVLVEKSQAVIKQKYLHAGANACLEKPFRSHQLLAQIEDLQL